MAPSLVAGQLQAVSPRGQYWVQSCLTSSLSGRDGGAECTLSKLAEDTTLGGVALRPGGRAAIRRDLGTLERWADRDLTQLSRGCCVSDAHWQRVPRELVESPSLEMFHSPVNTIVDNRLQVALLEQGVGPGDLTLQVTSPFR